MLQAWTTCEILNELLKSVIMDKIKNDQAKREQH